MLLSGSRPVLLGAKIGFDDNGIGFYVVWCAVSNQVTVI
ncbi:uncharacterized protein METZ01_LOCUS136546 [marine metagenome]|uniref:Uncharacterized protein n=1 Tax=marine metagenome TaxID=408172 RepID=A0A381Z490_9ZZZZ